MKKKYHLGIVVVLFCISCSSTKEKGLLVLENSINIQITEHSNEIIRNPLELALIGKTLLLLQYEGIAALEMYCVNNKTIRYCGKRGNGPHEFSVVRCWEINNSKREVLLYDEQYRKLRTYQYQMENDSLSLVLMNEISNPNTDGMSTFRNGRRLENGNYVVYSNAGFKKPIVVLNERLEVIDNLGNVPDSDHESDLRLSEYGGYFGTYKNCFVFAHGSVGYVAMYEQMKTGESVLKWEHYLETPLYNGTNLDFKNLKIGFNQVVMTARYIYCLYTGEKYPLPHEPYPFAQKLLVFDHAGNLVKNYQLDCPLKDFVLSTDEKTVYGICTSPEISVVEFSLL